MSEHVISVALLTVAGITCIAVMVHSVYPSIVEMSTSFSSSNKLIEERMETNIRIINQNSQSDIMYVWVKNIGQNRIVDGQIPWTDVFFGPENEFERVTYNQTGLNAPCWNYTIENDDGNGHWNEHETIKITINWDQTISSGDYYIKIITYNGVYDHEYFSI